MQPSASPAGRRVAVVGAGMVGSSWTALFLAHGLHVVVHDPDPAAEKRVREALIRIAPIIGVSEPTGQNLAEGLSFEADLERAVDGVDVVQESAPERLEVKQELWARIGRAVGDRALLLSSSSAITATLQGEQLHDARRLLVGHPLNPPYLMPLVEVVPGERTDPAATAEAVAFYESLGKVARVVKEVRGFVVSRLQRAMFAECLHLVQQGVVTVDELDDIVTNSVGLRWASDGPFRSFHLSGGATGLRGYFEKFGRSLQFAINHEPKVKIDRKLQELVISQAEATFGAVPREQLERERDCRQLAILRALRAANDRSEDNR